MIKVELNNESDAPYAAKFFSDVIKIAASYEKKINGIVEVNVIGSAAMKKLNWIYRGKNSDTDVLSFPWRDDKIVRSQTLGEIYLCYNSVKHQAKDWEVPVKEEMTRMLIHGLLHLVGHDHEKAKDARKMFLLQEKILKVCQSKK